MYCNSELRSFQQTFSQFDQRGIRLFAISVDPPETNRQHRKKLGLTYPLLSDPNLDAIRAYNLVHAGAGPGGSDVALPAEILVDSTGAIRWMNLTESAMVRVRPEQVLAAWDAL
jgi:peroxiredoxin